MVALAAVGRRFHLAQQGVHFVLIEAAAGADGAVAGHGRADGIKTLAQAEGVDEFSQLVGKVEDEALDVGLAEQRRKLPDHDAAVAERLQNEA